MRPWVFAASLIAALVAPLASIAGPIQLLKDIDRTVGFGGDNGRPLAVGATSYATFCTAGDTPTARRICNPWITDATQAGTHVLKHLDVPDNQVLGYYASLGSTVFFVKDAAPFRELWHSDGTAAGTSRLVSALSASNTVASSYSPLLQAGTAHLYFLDLTGGLWRADTTGFDISLIASNVSEFAVIGDGVVFAAATPSLGRELFVSDGTPAGTQLLMDMNAGSGDSMPHNFSVAAGRAFFLATSHTSDAADLWMTDGTPAGTQKLLSAVGEYNVCKAKELGGLAYFAAGASGSLQLWSTDGTTTTLRTSIAGSGFGCSLAVQAPYVYLSGIEQGVFRFDPAASSATAVTGGFTGPASLVAAGGDIYFDGQVSPSVNVLWRVAAGGTTAAAIPDSWKNPDPRVAVGSSVFLGYMAPTLYDPVNGLRAVQSADGEPSLGTACYSKTATVGTFTYFLANDGVHGCQLWKSDTTAAGTTMVKDLGTGNTALTIDGQSLVAAGGYVYFRAQTASFAEQAWRSDGTDVGTVPIVQQGTSSVIRSHWIQAYGDSALLFDWGNIWKVGPATAEATAIVTPTSVPPSPYIAFKPLAIVDDGFIFFGRPNTGSPPGDFAPDHLLKYTTASGTAAFITAISTQDFTPTAFPNAASIGNGVVFVNASAGPGLLWRTDGTAAGTLQILDNPAHGIFTPLMGPLGGKAYFGLNGWTYETDGTVAGTRAIGQPTPSGLDFSIDPNGNNLWFHGYDAGLYRIAAGSSTITQVGFASGPVVATNFGAYYVVGGGGVALSLDGQIIGGPSSYSLWVTNGSSSMSVGDLAPGQASGYFETAQIRPVALPTGVLFFASANGRGVEPYFVAYDATPDPITIPSATNVALSSTVISTPVTVQGISEPVAVSASNGQFCISRNSGCSCDVQPFATSGTIGPGQYMCVRHTSAATGSTTVTTLLQVAGTSTSFSSTTIPTYTVTVSLAGAGNGSVVSLPSGISCGASCSAIFTGGTALHLVAVRVPGSSFTGWSGSCTGNHDCDITLNSNVTLTANFAAGTIARLPGDLDGDGRTDLVWHNANGSEGVWMMNGTAPSSYAGISGGAGYTVKLTGDFDGDGRTDVLYRSTDGSYKIQLLNGATVVGENVILNGGTGWEVVGKGDFNGDGKTDLLWKAPNGTYGLWLMNGTTFSSAGLFQAPGPGWDSVVVADFDGDGKSDILWQDADGRVQMWLMNGFLSTAQADMVTTPNGWTPVLAADLDGDGKSDLVWKHTNGSIGVWMVNGTTITSYSIVLGAASGWSVKFAGDLDGDGKSDLILVHQQGTVGAWIMNGPAIVASANLATATSGWTVVGTGDFNGDGRTDLVWRSTQGEYGVWLMDGLVPLAYASLLGGGGGWSVIP